MATKRPQSHEIGIKLNKQGSARTYSDKDEGVIYNNNNEGLRVQTEGADRELVTDTQTQTLSGKTLTSPVVNGGTITSATISSPSINNAVLSQSVFDVDSNTLSNVEVDNFKSGVVLTTTVSVSINDANLFSAKAIKDYADSLNSAQSGALTSHLNDTTDAHDASAISSVPSGNLVATDVQAALNELQSDVDSRILTTDKGAVNGTCPLNALQKIDSTYLPSYVDDVVEVANYAALPVTGETGKIYVTLDTNLTYRWTGSVYVEISQSLALGETSATAYRGDRGKTAYDHSQLTSGTHGITGSFLGTTDAQVITNKDIDGGTAANTRRVTIPQDSLANITALTRKEGTVLYGNDTDKLYVDNGTTLTAVGAGGVGNPSTYALLKSDDDSSTWATGNNATFLGGGTLQGTFTKQSATNPLNGTYSYLYTQAAGSLNDYFSSESQPVPLRARNATNTATNLCRLKYTYDGANGDIRIIVYDVTNSTILTSLSQTVTANADFNRKNEVLFEVPATCVNLKFGFQVLVVNSGKVLKFDDIEMIDDPFTAVNLVESQTAYSYNGSATTGATVSNFLTGAPDNALFKHTSSGVTILKSNTTYTIESTCISTAGSTQYYVTINGVDAYVSTVSTTSESGVVVKNLKTQAENTTIGIRAVSAGVSNCVITVKGERVSSNVIQTWNDGTEWTSYNPTFSGLGTVTTSEFKWKKEGSDLLIYGKFNISTDASASEARIGLPNGLTSASTANNVNSAGTMWGSYVNASMFALSPLWESQKNYLTIGRVTSTTNGITKINGNALASNEQFIISARIPIAGWSSTPTLLALPTSQENRYEASFTSAGAVAGNNSVIGTAVVSDTSLYTIPLQAGIFTVAPHVIATINDPQTPANATTVVGIVSVSTTQVVVRTAYVDSAGQNVRYALPFNLTITKKTPDYKAPGVFVGNVQPEWQYDLTVTGTNWTTTRAVGVVYKMASGQYRMRGNILGPATSTTRAGLTLTVSGVTFKNVVGYLQPAVSYIGGFLTSQRCYANPNTGNFIFEHASQTTDSYGLTFDVELESKPAWATNTN